MASQRPIILKENKVHKKSGIPRMDLEALFKNNIVEVKFKRRIKPDEWFIKNRETGHKSYRRRMLCTSNWRYIKSPLTRNLFHWVRPKSRRGPSWYRTRGLVIVWDIFQNDWRMVSLDNYTILGFTPISKLRQQAEFTEFYRQHLKNIPEQKKDHYSDL